MDPNKDMAIPIMNPVEPPIFHTIYNYYNESIWRERERDCQIFLELCSVHRGEKPSSSRVDTVESDCIDCFEVFSFLSLVFFFVVCVSFVGDGCQYIERCQCCVCEL